MNDSGLGTGCQCGWIWMRALFGQRSARIRERSILIRKVFRVFGREVFLIVRQIIDGVN